MFVLQAAKDTTEAVPYIIQSADTLYKISRCFKISLDDLIAANPDIDPDNLTAGEKLYIPVSMQNISCSLGSVLYTVKEDDTIYKLSRSFNTKVSALLKSNPHIYPDSLIPGQPICIPQLWSQYTNDSLKISFLYPIKWAKINEFHYEGVDGFFRLSALNYDKPLEDLCKSEAFHKLKPYGSKPDIINMPVAGHNAGLVLPSKDQPMEMKKQSAVIIQCSEPLIVTENTYTHLVLWIDTLHLNDIMNSINLDD